MIMQAPKSYMMATNLGALDDSGEVRPRADYPKGLELGFGVRCLTVVHAVSLDRAAAKTKSRQP
jgi:hypothetical protein